LSDRKRERGPVEALKEGVSTAGGMACCVRCFYNTVVRVLILRRDARRSRKVRVDRDEEHRITSVLA
jgi:hypothetical protein